MGSDANVTLLCLLVSAALIHLAWKKVPAPAAGWTFWVFMVGTLFGFVMGMASVSCGVEAGHYCDKLQDHCR